MNQQQRVFEGGMGASQAPVESAHLINAMAQQADVIGIGAVGIRVEQQPHASGVQ